MRAFGRAFDARPKALTSVSDGRERRRHRLLHDQDQHRRALHQPLGHRAEERVAEPATPEGADCQRVDVAALQLGCSAATGAPDKTTVSVVSSRCAARSSAATSSSRCCADFIISSTAASVLTPAPPMSPDIGTAGVRTWASTTEGAPCLAPFSASSTAARWAANAQGSKSWATSPRGHMEAPRQARDAALVPAQRGLRTPTAWPSRVGWQTAPRRLWLSARRRRFAGWSDPWKRAAHRRDSPAGPPGRTRCPPPPPPRRPPSTATSASTATTAASPRSGGTPASACWGSPGASRAQPPTPRTRLQDASCAAWRERAGYAGAAHRVT